MIDSITVESELFHFKINDIATRPTLSVDERMRGFLEVGRKAFGVPIGIISRVKGKKYALLHTAAPAGTVSPGDVFDLGVTYCVHTLNHGGPTAFSHVSAGELRHHPCFKTFGLETYIGAPVTVGGRIFGTVNFSSPLIRENAFLSSDLKGIGAMADAIGRLLDDSRKAGTPPVIQP